MDDMDIRKAADIIAQVESKGNVNSPRGDAGTAYGILQIRQGCLTDVNRANGTNIKLTDLEGARELSYWVFAEYMKLYARTDRLGHEATLVDMGRIWNGGPNGYKRSATLHYADLVRAAEKRFYV